MSRRDFLAAGGLGVVGLSAAEQASRKRLAQRRGARSVLLVLMNGGASALETFDPRPGAPKEVRGPYRAIHTAVPGTTFSELLPRLAVRNRSFAVLRTLHHAGAPLHEPGLQWLQAGASARRAERPLAMGARLQRAAHLEPGDAPAYVVVPARLQRDSSRAPSLDGPAADADPGAPQVVDPRSASEPPANVLRTSWSDQPAEVAEAYGDSLPGRSLWAARRLLEQGARWVTVNLQPVQQGAVTWDAHGACSAPATLRDYANSLCPQFDRALAALIDDLQDTGLSQDVLVVCTGEMGRTPRVNSQGGRDHWTRCWSGLLFGAGVPGGALLGAADASAAEPVDRPIPLQELAAAMALAAKLEPEPAAPSAPARPLHELLPG